MEKSIDEDMNPKIVIRNETVAGIGTISEVTAAEETGGSLISLRIAGKGRFKKVRGCL